MIAHFRTPQVLQVLYDRHIRIPDDLSIVSFDDTHGLEMAPALTELDMVAEEIGRQAVDLIVEHNQLAPAGRASAGRRVVLEPRLHRRASTRPIVRIAPGQAEKYGAPIAVLPSV